VNHPGADSTPFVALSMRISLDPVTGERRDALDRQWYRFFKQLGFSVLPLPNDVDAALLLLNQCRPALVVLTGGNDLGVVGGDAPERDEVENAVISWCDESNTHLVGVCRGCQMVAVSAGAGLKRVEGHVRRAHAVHFSSGSSRTVNSYHSWAIAHVPSGWSVLAVSDDSQIEAIRRDDAKFLGLMWHPEREIPFSEDDLQLFRGFINGVT
jgi:anthranilate/para-aminobenzoate synthase component II